MLPSPAELRELAERINAAVPHAPTDEMKQLLAGYASRLAQVAEQLERLDPDMDALVRRANIERYERLLTGALEERTRRTVEALLGQEHAAHDKERRQIARGAGERRRFGRSPTTSGPVCARDDAPHRRQPRHDGGSHRGAACRRRSSTSSSLNDCADRRKPALANKDSTFTDRGGVR